MPRMPIRAFVAKFAYFNLAFPNYYYRHKCCKLFGVLLQNKSITDKPTKIPLEMLMKY